MKTWEMIKELTENPKKKFINIGSATRYKTKLDSRGRVATDSDQYFMLCKENLQHGVWQEVKEPVDFMTAMLAVANNSSQLKVRHYYIERFEEFEGIPGAYDKWLPFDVLMADLSNDFDILELSTIILHGDWYIDEE